MTDISTISPVRSGEFGAHSFLAPAHDFASVHPRGVMRRELYEPDPTIVKSSITSITDYGVGVARMEGPAFLVGTCILF